mmetsp:Transcript_5652/g.25100  ORF Transcript_5652/g.25100 Transcript_5652/m.25100 type:complete len:305 (+) Transcript_5652:453-1367(+)
MDRVRLRRRDRQYRVLGRGARVRPRRLLRQPRHPGHRGVHPALLAPRPVLLVAAIARGAPLAHEPRDGGRDPRPGAGQHPRQRRGVQAPRHARRGALHGPQPRRRLPPRLANLPPHGSVGGPRPRSHEPLQPQRGRPGQARPVPGQVARQGVAKRRRRRRHDRRARRVGGFRGFRLARRGAVPRALPGVQLLARAVHLAAAHRRGRAPLRGGPVEPGQGRVHDHRPPVRVHIRLFAPPHREHPRGAPHQPHHPALPREGGDRGAQGGVPGSVPLRSHAHRDGDLEGGQQVHRGVQAGERVGVHG